MSEKISLDSSEVISIKRSRIPLLPKLRKSLLMNRLEHGTNPNYKYIVSDNPEQISAGKNENKPRYF